MEAVGPFWRNTRQCDGVCVCSCGGFLAPWKASYSQGDDITLEELLAKTQAIIKDETAMREPVIAMVQSTEITWSSPGIGPPVICCEYNGPNHFVRDCVKRQKTTCVYCYQITKTDHRVRNCLGNKVRNEISAPVYSPESKRTQRYRSYTLI